ncbi:NIPSNAP family protein [Paralimibaculum aggregatum]|uniref:NIPSNAP family protein n=1 Tax=Paralimibaculum aggregatum TaxID=3036245 RepID=A0ABQ6LS60_9RHOB|nr:NIPSNAP family protein [Limibaculum sp. NKW23]GMG84854.1 NIPSNAP family protein [Limibaculum sp. NKW23]
MFVDERIYTLHAGQVPVFLKLYQEKGMAVQLRILGRMVGYYTTDFGPLNQIVHMWGYDSLDDRFERRKRLQASPEWQDYAREMRPLVTHVENKLLVPAPFFTPVAPITADDVAKG